MPRQDRSELAVNLTDKERRFIINVEAGMDLKPAALAAGYHEDSVSKLIHRPTIAAVLQEIYVKSRDIAQINRMDVIDGMKDAIQDAKLLGDPASQIRGWREIGLIIGAYAPETKTINVNVTHEQLIKQIDSMSTDQLLEIAGQDTLDVIEGVCEEVEEEDG